MFIASVGSIATVVVLGRIRALRANFAWKCIKPNGRRAAVSAKDVYVYLLNLAFLCFSVYAFPVDLPTEHYVIIQKFDDSLKENFNV